MLRIELVRSGGFGNLILRRALDTDDLAADESEAMVALVGRIDLEGLAARSPIRGAGADRFQYDLTVTRGDVVHQVTVAEDQAPPDLRQLFDRVVDQGRPSP